MELSIGDKVRVYFYPPKSTRSFVDGVVDRSEIGTFRGLSFSLQITREVVLGHEVSAPRSLPYIIAYVKDDDFEGRIEVLEAAIQPEAAPAAEALSGTEADHLPETELDRIPEEPSLPLQAKVQAEPRRRGWARFLNRAA